VTVTRAANRLDQPNALVVAKSVRGHSATLSHGSDCVTSVSHQIQPTSLSTREVNVGKHMK
jgi:hypothetical protein